jgi:ClpP class serine protease
VGGISVLTKTLDLVKFSKTYGVKLNKESSGKHKMRINPFSELKDEDKLWMQKLIDDRAEAFRKVVLEKRGNKIPRNKELEELALGGEAFMGAKAVELGLVDSVNSLRGVVIKEYGDSKLVEFKIERKKWSRMGRRSGVELSEEELAEIVDEMPAGLISNRLFLKSF